MILARAEAEKSIKNVAAGKRIERLSLFELLKKTNN
jgi:hypothetical protein